MSLRAVTGGVGVRAWSLGAGTGEVGACDDFKHFIFICHMTIGLQFQALPREFPSQIMFSLCAPFVRYKMLKKAMK